VAWARPDTQGARTYAGGLVLGDRLRAAVGTEVVVSCLRTRRAGAGLAGALAEAAALALAPPAARWALRAERAPLAAPLTIASTISVS